MGDIRLAREQGMVSAYLNVTAIIFALVVAAIAIGVTIGVYGPTYYLQQCIQLGMQTNHVHACSKVLCISYTLNFVGYCESRYHIIMLFSLQLDPEVRIQPSATAFFFVAKVIVIIGMMLSPQTIAFDA